MNRIENVGEKNNEWVVIYANLGGETVVKAVDTYIDATKFARRLAERDESVIGIMTSGFYNAKLADK